MTNGISMRLDKVCRDALSKRVESDESLLISNSRNFQEDRNWILSMAVL